MPQVVINLERKNTKRFGNETIQTQLDYLIGRAVAGNRSQWKCEESTINEPERTGSTWTYDVLLSFERQKSVAPDRLNNELDGILKFLNSAGSGSKFKNFPWTIKGVLPDWKSGELTTIDLPVAETDDVNEVIDFNRAVPLDQIEFPDLLLYGSDDEIESHPAFRGIYGRAPYIRVLFSSIKTMKDTNGLRRNHCLLHGKPGTAKTSLFRGMQQVLGVGSYLNINANSATRAGIETIFLRRLKTIGVPPFIFIEEIEKTLEAILTVWLSILDERAEVRKITHHSVDKQEVRSLCFATANDKVLFDRLTGGRPGHPGALSSRFTKPLYVPRPDWNIMKRILLRDIDLYGGQYEWADKCIDIAKEIGTNDPRIVLSLLDGGDRLISGGYKEDIMQIYNMEKTDRRQDRDLEEVSLTVKEFA